jgi:hypothetical protein
MLPPEVHSPAEVWVAEGKRAACQDLLSRILTLPELYNPVYVLADWEEDRQQLDDSRVELLPPVAREFHFGEVLAGIIRQKELHQVAYFGGASAPLLTADHLRDFAVQFQNKPQPFGLVNNYHSTDWGLFSDAERISNMHQRLPTDNPLGWVLHHEAEFEIQACPAAGFSRADVDTPADLIMLRQHPALGQHLQTFLINTPPYLLDKVEAIRELLSTPASTLALIGRASPHVQLVLQNQTQIWVRAFIEERGMVASHRLAKGEVKSLIGAMIETWGVQLFMDHLVELCDGALWDTRVWMGHAGGWPSAADRFAADLGWLDDISDEPLRQLTSAIHEAPKPILAGGYGVVAGGLYAMLETLAVGENYQPSK